MDKSDNTTNKEYRSSDKFSAFLGSSARATIRFFKYLPWRIKNIITRKINDYKHRPPRTDINKVYVLVGYTTRKHVDDKYRAERNMIILRRTLLLVILVLLLIISLNSLFNITNFDEIQQIFGIKSWSEVTENDPFSKNNTKLTDSDVNLYTITPTPTPDI